MKDDLTRRDFLKGVGLAVAGIAGASVLSRPAWAQESQEPEEEKEKPEEDKAEEDKKDESKPEESEEKKEEPDYDKLFENNETGEEEETRACPQCGALMYRQGRTWTCENCGYSYVE